MTDHSGIAERIAGRILSDSERERASRFRFPQHAATFISAHVSLRLILSRYTGVDPRDLDFHVETFGKPSLKMPCRIRFNLSHSNELTLIAVTRDREVGIDVEHLRPEIISAQLAARVFHPEELRALDCLEEDAARDLFFRLWTRKEALLKCYGTGIARGELTDVAVLRAVPHYSIVDLSPGPSYYGALAVAGDADLILRDFDWNATQ